MIEHPLKRAHFFSWGKSCKDGIKTLFLVISHVSIDVPQVLNVFPIASHFYPICFPQSSPFFSCIVGSKERALHLYIETLILGSLQSFSFLFKWANKKWPIATNPKIFIK
jgi:hypothetical protein